MAITNPNPVDLTDQQAQALEGETHALCRTTMPPYQSVDREDLVRLIHRLEELVALDAEGRVWDEGGLNVGVGQLRYKLAGTAYHFEGATGYALDDDATNYVYLDADEAVKHSTSAWPGTVHHPLALVTTAAGDITVITDVRNYNYGRGSAEGWAAIAATQNVDLDGNDLVNVDELELDDASADASATGRLRRNGAELTYHTGVAAYNLLHTGKIAGVANGGTGLATITAYALLLGNGTGAVALVSPGTTGVPLLSQGAAANPAFVAIDLSDTNVTAAAALPASRGGTGETAAECVPFSITMEIAGTLVAQVYTWTWIPAWGGTITEVSGCVGTAPTGATLIVDVRDDTVSIWSGVQVNMVNIVASATEDTASASHAFAAGSKIDVEVEQIGSAVAGADLTITISGVWEHQTS